jgi:hypothetical protein
MRGKKLDFTGVTLTWAGPADAKEANELIGKTTSQLHLADMLGRVYAAGAAGIGALECAAATRELVLVGGNEKDKTRVEKMTDTKHLGWLTKKYASVISASAAVVAPEAVVETAITEEAVVDAAEAVA